MTFDPTVNGPGRYPVEGVVRTMAAEPQADNRNIPHCKVCDEPGHMVETITDMIVWHHEDGALEEHHDFDPDDGRPTFISGAPCETVGVLVEFLNQVDPETIPVRVQDRDGGSLRSVHHVAVHIPEYPDTSGPVLVITGY